MQTCDRGSAQASAGLLAFITVGLSALAYAQGTGTGVVKVPQDIEFKGPLIGPPQLERFPAKLNRGFPIVRE